METTKKLSITRIILAVIILALVIFGVRKQEEHAKEKQTISNNNPWFAAYVDVTATPTYAFEQLGDSKEKNVVLSFIVSSPTDPCIPSWGISHPLDKASSELDLDRRIARLKQQGGDIVISFGGLINDELAIKCTDKAKLLLAYESVIDRYSLDTIDLDIEGDDLLDSESIKRRSEVIAKLQEQKRANGKSLAVWLTLPAATFGLTSDGANLVREMLSSGVDLAGVNIMTMNFGESRKSSESMGQASIASATETHRQLGIIYKQKDINLSSTTLWAKIGLTPMIGQNDIKNEVFNLDDAESLNNFAREKGVTRISMWSANRDRECGENYVDVKAVSDSCSGIKQVVKQFAAILGNKFEGSISSNSGSVTKNDLNLASPLPDDPKTSPYQIWQEKVPYLTGTKVVWHGNVYQAKWWTEGDIPDNPVLQSWETPWQLVGPVLPGESPLPTPKLPKGTYPNWDGKTIYDTGDRVLFGDVAYQAKWWTQGDSPAASSSDREGSPWVPLTIEQVELILKKIR